ncbi:hypothetical protein HZS_1418 [Henneguya salminicola]|nr:hypothetical protein HZS_1418 [Henneguya salminicola]
MDVSQTFFKLKLILILITFIFYSLRTNTFHSFGVKIKYTLKHKWNEKNIKYYFEYNLKKDGFSRNFQYYDIQIRLSSIVLKITTNENISLRKTVSGGKRINM